MLPAQGMRPPLRPFQIEALDALARHSQTLCIAPTGSGKTRIIEEFSLLNASRILVISPLVALSRQLQERLSGSGIEATTGPDSSPPSCGKRSRAWILSPESLQNPRTIQVLSQWKPHLGVIDECHCIWDWGRSFRPSFATLPEDLRRLNLARTLWLTASLPIAARIDLQRRLPATLKVVDHFELQRNVRIRLEQVPLALRVERLRHWIGNHSESGILFAGTRANTEQLSRLLANWGRPALGYHAGLSSEERRSIETKIRCASRTMNSEVIVATSAFGMGMDYPHLRWVLYWQAPSSLLELIQGFGRAGRDHRQNSFAACFWDYSDFRAWEWSIRENPERRQELERGFDFFKSKTCRVTELSRHFSDKHFGPCGRCDVCESSA